VIIGLIGAAIPVAVIYLGYQNIIQWMMEKFHVLTVFMEFVPVHDVIILLAPLSLVIGVFIGLFGSSITIRKYLKA
jgi:cell division transport system permease protein